MHALFGPPRQEQLTGGRRRCGVQAGRPAGRSVRPPSSDIQIDLGSPDHVSLRGDYCRLGPAVHVSIQ
jgi:hypothetical protein